MSRSINKLCIFKLKNDKYYKRLANKRARHTDIQDGKSYKKLLCSYDICDYKKIINRKDYDYYQIYFDLDINKGLRK
jgi:hypothetical protein